MNAPAYDPLFVLLADLRRDGRPSLAWATEWMPDGTLRRAWEACALGPAMVALLLSRRVQFAWHAGRAPVRVLEINNDEPVIDRNGVVGYVKRPATSELHFEGGLVLCDGAPQDYEGRDAPAWIRDAMRDARMVLRPAVEAGAAILRAAVDGVPTLRL